MKRCKEEYEAAKIWLGQYWCGCGASDEAKKTLMEVLDWWKPRADVSSLMIDLPTMQKFEDVHGQGVTTAFLYFLNGTGIAEHGSSVYGSWLTKTGMELKEYLPFYEDE